MTDILDKYAALGLNPPGEGHDLEQTYHETVQNIVRQHRAAVMAQADPLAEDHKLAAHVERAGHHEKLLKKVAKDDYERAVAAIKEAESYPQHVAPIGGEATASVEEGE